MNRSRWMVFVALAVVLIGGTAAFAELRTWRAASGGYETEAEFVELKNGTVILKKSDGATVAVPLDKLSADDVAYVNGLTGNPTPAKPTGGDASITDPTAGAVIDADVPECLKAVEREAVSCSSAAEAVQVYKFFLAHPDITAEQRAAAPTRLAHWEQLDKDDYQRVGTRWMPREEADALHQQADEMVVHAVELLRLKNHQLAHEELEKASRLDPSSEKADFLMGWVYALVAHNANKGVQHFGECVRRNPKNFAALNNLAACEIIAGKHVGAVKHWREAIALNPELQIVADNVGTAIELDGQTWRIPKNVMVDLNDLYRDLLAHTELAPATKSRTLTFLTPYGKKFDQKDAFADFAGPPPDQEFGFASGTGFVIAPGYVLTNFHVVEDAESIMIVPLNWKADAAKLAQQNSGPADKDKSAPSPDKALGLVASLVDRSKTPDLALLKCEALTAPAISLSSTMARRGTDVMVLGYPGGLSLGAELKSTRGAVVTVSEPAMEKMCIHTAATNPGNSGGPIVDQQGRVVAVVVAVTTSLINNYGLGIPVDEVWPFLKKNLPKMQPAKETTTLDWPDVDGRVSPSVVMIICKVKMHAGPDDED